MPPPPSSQTAARLMSGNNTMTGGSPAMTNGAPAMTGGPGMMKGKWRRRTRSSGSGDLPSLQSATRWLNSPPLTAEQLRGKVVVGRFLDLLLHQLSAFDSTCGPGPKLQGTRAGRHRRAHAGVAFERKTANIRRRSPISRSAIRSRSTTTMRSGAASRTSTGRHITSSTRKAASAITTLAKEIMTSLKGDPAAAEAGKANVAAGSCR